jgi:hypothetical protein
MQIKQILFPLTAAFLGFAAVIIFLELLFRMLPVRESLKYLAVNEANPIIRFKENRDILWSKGPYFSIVTKKHVNNYGFFNNQDYNPKETSPLLAIVGDSYVEAFQVANKDAMHGILAEKAHGKGRVYSFGASGSQLPTYLAYARYAVEKFHANAIVFIIIGNDFDESLRKYRNYPAFHYFSGNGNKFDIIRNDFIPPQPRQPIDSALVRYLVCNLEIYSFFDNIKARLRKDDFVGNTFADFNKERVSDSEAAVDKFLNEISQFMDVKNVLFVIDGMRPNLYSKESLKKAQGSYFDLMRKYFLKAASAQGYETIDMQPFFIKKYNIDGMRFEFPYDGHWNENGHALVAERIQASVTYRKLFEHQNRASAEHETTTH